MNVKSVLITAGPTREKIDPIRFISNYSTGVFGYHIAEEANRKGCRVTLVSGPTKLEAPRGVKLIRVESALEMKRAVGREFKRHNCLIMAAAVSDWRVRSLTTRKIKRSSAKKVLRLEKNPDILQEMAAKKGARLVVGFALETENLERNAFKKLKEKRLDLIVANALTDTHDVFGEKKISVLILDRFGNKTPLPPMPKKWLAKIILDKVLNFKI